ARRRPVVRLHLGGALRRRRRRRARRAPRTPPRGPAHERRRARRARVPPPGPTRRGGRVAVLPPRTRGLDTLRRGRRLVGQAVPRLAPRRRRAPRRGAPGRRRRLLSPGAPSGTAPTVC